MKNNAAFSNIKKYTQYYINEKSLVQFFTKPVKRLFGKNI